MFGEINPRKKPRAPFISIEEALEETLAKPQLYAYLLFAADSGDDTFKRLSQRAAEFGNRMSRELLFFDLEIMSLPDESFNGLVQDGRLAGYRHYLESVRKFHPYTLTEREEQLRRAEGGIEVLRDRHRHHAVPGAIEQFAPAFTP